MHRCRPTLVVSGVVGRKHVHSVETLPVIARSCCPADSLALQTSITLLKLVLHGVSKSGIIFDANNHVAVYHRLFHGPELAWFRHPANLTENVLKRSFGVAFNFTHVIDGRHFRNELCWSWAHGILQSFFYVETGYLDFEHETWGWCYCLIPVKNGHHFGGVYGLIRAKVLVLFPNKNHRWAVPLFPINWSGSCNHSHWQPFQIHLITMQHAHLRSPKHPSEANFVWPAIKKLSEVD